MQPDVRTAVWEACRPQLIAYAARMVAQRSIAEELTQEAGLRLLDAGTAAEGDAQVRAWLFKVVTNLALDHLKRHSTWRELSISGIRARAERDAAFVADSVAMKGSPELRSIAREHLTVCFACTLRNLAPRQASKFIGRPVRTDLSHSSALPEKRPNSRAFPFRVDEARDHKARLRAPVVPRVAQAAVTWVAKWPLSRAGAPN